MPSDKGEASASDPFAATQMAPAGEPEGTPVPPPPVRVTAPPPAHPPSSAASSAEVSVAPDSPLARSRSADESAAMVRTAEVLILDAPSQEKAVHVGIEIPKLGGQERFENGPLLGSGGMGDVVLQHDRNIGRGVAKKMLRPEMHLRENSVRRFIREARVQGQLEHPAVVPVHDFGVDDDGRLFFSMKRIRGRTLGQILDALASRDRETTAQFSRHKLLSSFVQVCLAIEYAHKRGVIHRDLKPNNVMLGDFGEVYVLDWGLAKLSGKNEVEDMVASVNPARASRPDVTSDGDFLGTPLYMPPEQLLGRHAFLDERADVFGLGVILFEILTLQHFRKDGTLVRLLDEAETNAAPERPSKRVDDVPKELDDLCVSALAPDPAARLGSARALADAITRYLEGDRDMAARRAQASELVTSARARLGAPAETRADELVVALREALKALALAPGEEDAQRLLVSLVLEGSRDLSPDAKRAFAERDVETRVQGLRRGIAGFFLWLGAAPAALVVGVRDWSLVAALCLLTIACIAFSLFILRTPAALRSKIAPMTLAAMAALVVAMGSAYLGPFVVVPLAALGVTMMFMIHGKREEAAGLVAVSSLGLLAAFGVEWLHIFPPAYTFQGGDIVLHARMLKLPEVPTVGFLLYTSVSFVVFLGYFVAQLRGKQRIAERQLFGQAWLLQRLFPVDEAKPVPKPRASRKKL